MTNTNKTATAMPKIELQSKANLLKMLMKVGGAIFCGTVCRGAYGAYEFSAECHIVTALGTETWKTAHVVSCIN